MKIVIPIAVLLFAFLGVSSLGYSQKAAVSVFKVVPLGIRGGLDESNLSAYMIAPVGSDNYVCADAGTVRFGIERGVVQKAFKADVNTVLRTYIKGFLISHGHLDHVSGLIINSPEDTVKNIYAMPYVLDVLRERYFTWESWANFADQGEKPVLSKYHYVGLHDSGEAEIANTSMKVKAFALSHSSPYQSTAFLINAEGNYLLYFGDTGADTIESSNKLRLVWQEIAPLVRSHKLKAIFLEVSYPNTQPDKQLFGHLTPKLFMQEMDVLQQFAGQNSLAGLPVVVTHIKPTDGSENVIKSELKQANRFGLKLVYPVQGKMLTF